MAKKLTKFCSLVKFIQQEIDANLAQVIQDLCLDSLLTPRKNMGITFVVPTKEVRETIMKLAYTDQIDEASKHIKAHIIFDFLPTAEAFKLRGHDIINALHQKLDITEIKDGHVKLRTGIMERNKKFVPYKTDNMVVYDMIQGTIPINSPQTKMIQYDLAKPRMMSLHVRGGAVLDPKTLFLSDMNNFEKYLMGDHTTNILLERMVSYMKYMYSKNRGAYFDSVLPYIDPSEVGYFTTLRLQYDECGLGTVDWLASTHGICISKMPGIREELKRVYEEHTMAYYEAYNGKLTKEEKTPLAKLKAILKFTNGVKQELLRNVPSKIIKTIKEKYAQMYRSKLALWTHDVMFWGHESFKVMYGEQTGMRKLEMFKDFVLNITSLHTPNDELKIINDDNNDKKLCEELVFPMIHSSLLFTSIPPSYGTELQNDSNAQFIAKKFSLQETEPQHPTKLITELLELN